MSLILPSTVAPGPSASPSASAAMRYDEQSQNMPGSFGEALARSLPPAAEKTEKTVAKAALIPPGRRQADKLEPDAQDLVNVLGLSFIPLENRTAKATLTVAAGTASDSTVPGTATASLRGPDSTVPGTIATSLEGPDSIAPKAAAASLRYPDSALPGAATASPNAVLANMPAFVEVPAITAEANTNAGTHTALVPVLAPASQKGASQDPLQARLTPVSDGQAFALASGKTAGQASAPYSGFSEQSSKHDDKGTHKQDESIDASAELMPVATRGTTKVAGNIAAATPETMARADAAPDAPVSPSAALPVNLTSIAAQGPIGPAAPNVPSTVMTASLAPEVGSNEWGKALGQHVIQMGNAGHQLTELQLNPPGLGPLKVMLSMNDHQMQAMFVSAHSSVRAAVEAALPQLRSTLADNGISLGHTSVGAESQQQTAFANGQNSQPQRGTYRPAEVAGTDTRLPARTVTEPVRRSNGISIDTYA
jgi:flagellar hook-length control protein FliK